MIQAKDGVRICTECGRQFTPQFPDKGDKWDEICLYCEANLTAPDWFGAESETA